MQAFKPTLGIKSFLLGLRNSLTPSILLQHKKISNQPLLSRFSQPLSANKKLILSDLSPTKISNYLYELAEDSLTKQDILPTIEPTFIEMIDDTANRIVNKSNIELSLKRTKSDTLDRSSNNRDYPKPKSRGKSKSKSTAKTVPPAGVEAVYPSFEKTSTISSASSEWVPEVESPLLSLSLRRLENGSNIQSNEKSANTEDKSIEEASILVPPKPNVANELTVFKSAEDSQQTTFKSPQLINVPNSELSRDTEGGTLSRNHRTSLPIASDSSTVHQTINDQQPDTLPNTSITHQTINDQQPDTIPERLTTHLTIDERSPDITAPILSRHHPLPPDIAVHPSAVAAVESTTVLPESLLSTLPERLTTHLTTDDKQPDALSDRPTTHLTTNEQPPDTIAPALLQTSDIAAVPASHHPSPPDIPLHPNAVEGSIDTLNSSTSNKFGSNSRSIQKDTRLTELDRSTTFNDLPPPQGFAVGGHVVASNVISPQQIAASDTVPAMLTPGEFVINAKDTQKNLDLLQHINRGGVPEVLTPSAAESPNEVQDTGLADSTKVYSWEDNSSVQRKSSDSTLTTAWNPLAPSSRLNTAKQISVLSPLQSNSLNRRETPDLSKGTTQYSSTPLIFRQQAPVNNTPPEWSSIEDLLSGSGTGNFDDTTLNFGGVETNTIPKGFATGGQVTASNTVIATPGVASPPQGGIAKIMQEPKTQTDTNSPDLEALAREIYNRLRQRLEVERERYGFYSGRLPW